MRHLRILDTNRLIAHWQRSRKGPLSSYSREDASRWAEALIKLDSTAAVLTPVVLEFLLAIEYLSRFENYYPGKEVPHAAAY
jgi:hypothetical protein